MNFDDIVMEHTNILADYGFKLGVDNQQIPVLYWTAKLHKTPYKSRFIAGLLHSTLKQPFKELALVLKCIQCQFKGYCHKIKSRTGINYYWNIENSLQCLNGLKHLKATIIATYDFSILYTSLPLQSIYDNLETLIIKMFINSVNHYINVNTYMQSYVWSNTPRSGYASLNIDKTLQLLHFLLFNTYVRCGPYIFLQTQGIPMGLPVSGYVATLSLGWLEFQFMDKLAKRDKQLAITLSDVTRYFDDICVTNFRDFDNITKSIYPTELPLVRSTSDIMRDSFLDLDILVVDACGHFKVGIYNKTDHFDFPVITFPFPDSNISTKVVYNCFYSQLVRFATICTDLDRFFERTNILYNKLVYRDYSSNILLKTSEKLLNNYSQLVLNNCGEIPKIKQQMSSYVDSPLPAPAFEVSTPDVETSFYI